MSEPSMGSISSTHVEKVLAGLLEEITSRLQEGQPVDWDEYAASYPEYAPQIRELVRREGAVSVYKLILHLDADPLIEFGSSHRLVWIQKLPEVRSSDRRER